MAAACKQTGKEGDTRNSATVGYEAKLWAMADPEATIWSFRMVQTEGTREVSRSIDNDSLFPARLVDSDLDLANIPTLGHSPDAVLDLAFGSGMRFMDGYALVARSTEFRDFAIQSMTKYRGRQRVPAESLAHFVVVVAPKPVVERFGRLIKPLLARAGAGSTESRSRAALRDRLLPHLISGALRVKDAERVIKAATV